MKKNILVLLVLCFVVTGFVLAGDCPKANVLKKVTTDMASFKAVQPLDFSKIVSAKAVSVKDGQKVFVSFSNVELTGKQLKNDMVVPLKKKGQYIVTVRFDNAKKKVVEGTYTPTGYGKPFRVYPSIKVFKGTAPLGLSPQINDGKAVIVKLTDKMICGTFELLNKNGKTAVVGEFSMELEHSKW